MKSNHRQSAFTLIETTLVIGITTLLGVSLFGLYEWHGKVYNYQQGVVRTSGSARNSLAVMQEYILQGYRIVQSHTFNGTIRTSSGTVVVVQLPAANASGSILSGVWDYAVFYQSGTSLMMEVDADNTSSRRDLTKKLSDTVSSLLLTYDNADFSLVKKVSIDMSVSTSVRDQTITDHLTEDVILRNY